MNVIRRIEPLLLGMGWRGPSSLRPGVGPAPTSRARGFALIELLVVMIVIAALAAIAIPVFTKQEGKAASTSAKSDASNISRSLAALFVDSRPTGISGQVAAADHTQEMTITATYGPGAGAATEEAVVQVGQGNRAVVTEHPTLDYCVLVEPSDPRAATWIGTGDGLQKATACPP